MSKKNADRSRTERAQAALAEQQRAERHRRFAVIGSVLAVVVIVIGGAFLLQSSRDTTGKEPTVTPTGAAASVGDLEGGLDGYTVTIGEESAPTTIRLYEDFQCPICAEFEKEVGDRLTEAVEDGSVKVEFRPVSFLDRASGNDYSSRAMNAALAVLDDAGPGAYLRFHTIAFANQPEENTDGPEDDELVEWAVQAGADEAAVTPQIEDKVFEQFIVNATDQMSKDGVNGTPTAVIDGEQVDGFPAQAVLDALK